MEERGKKGVGVQKGKEGREGGRIREQLRDGGTVNLAAAALDRAAKGTSAWKAGIFILNSLFVR